MKPWPRPPLIRGFGLLIAYILMSCAAAWSAPPSALEILSVQTVPADLESYPTDVRWASDDSVFLARFFRGVFEVALDGRGTVRRQLMPSPEELGLQHGFKSLAASSSHLAVSSTDWFFGWQEQPQEGQEKVAPELHRHHVPIVDDIDVAGDRLLFYGVFKDAPFAPDGAILWLGSFSRLRHLKPLLFDQAGAGARSFGRCGGFQVGAVRFLPDGSIFAAPGVQPGVHLFSAEGQLLRTWDSAAIGIDTDTACTGMSLEEVKLLARDVKARVAWFNRHRMVDDVLPLRQGAGVLVRHFEAGKVHWDLKLLHADGRIDTFVVPFVGDSPYARLQGDVRDGRIVLLVSDRDGHEGTLPPALLFVARLSNPDLGTTRTHSEVSHP